MIIRRTFAAMTIAFAALVSPLGGELVQIEIVSREPVLDGRSFGVVGPYELITAIAHFAVDPNDPMNGVVVDLSLAPRRADGRVEFSATLLILQPIDLSRGNGTMLLDIANRGDHVILGVLNGGARTRGVPLDPQDPEVFGDGFLMRHGFTVAWVGWQFDLATGAIRVEVPVAQDGGEPVAGHVLHEFTPPRPMPAADLPSPYAAFNPSDPANRLWRFARGPEGTREEVPRTAWQMDATSVSLQGGFQPGYVYELLYTSTGPPLSGLGFVAVRDFVSQAKYGDEPLVAIERAVGFGVSQSGRFLRDFLRHGFNADEHERIVFDGLMPVIAGAGGGYFNHRFAQPGQVGGPFPSDRFPFADLPQVDPLGGGEGGLLDRSREHGVIPRIFYLNTASEYDDRGGSLVHTLADGSADAELAGETRLFTVLGAPHGGGGIRQQPDRQALTSPIEYRWTARALAVAMHRWISEGEEPPASRYPRVAGRTLVPYEELEFPSIPGVLRPSDPYRVRVLDLGVGMENGVVEFPPRYGPAYPVLVPSVDADGNEVEGIRMPELAVPLATYTGWNVAPYPGGHGLVSLSGSYLPFPWSDEQRAATGDPRRSIEERYRSREEYFGLYTEAALELIDDGFLLVEDLPSILGIARERWALAETQPPPVPAGR